MSNLEQKVMVANNCPGYDPIAGGFSSSAGSPEGKSCDSCENFKNEKCQVDLYDDVLTSLDQT